MLQNFPLNLKTYFACLPSVLLRRFADSA